jgi:hypothetical protein
VLDKTETGVIGSMAVVNPTPLQVYHKYLNAIEEEARQTPQSEYLDLLSQGEAIDLLCARDEIEEDALQPTERQELARLDDLLLKHHRLISAHVPLIPDKPRSQWWWHLDKGPQVREEAGRAA